MRKGGKDVSPFAFVSKLYLTSSAASPSPIRLKMSLEEAAVE